MDPRGEPARGCLLTLPRAPTVTGLTNLEGTPPKLKMFASLPLPLLWNELDLGGAG